MGAGLAVALTTGEVIELSPLDGKIRREATEPSPAPGTSTPPASSAAPAAATMLPVRLQAATVSPDGKRLYTITIAKDYSRTLTAWGRK